MCVFYFAQIEWHTLQKKKKKKIKRKILTFLKYFFSPSLKDDKSLISFVMNQCQCLLEVHSVEKLVFPIAGSSVFVSSYL